MSELSEQASMVSISLSHLKLPKRWEYRHPFRITGASDGGVKSKHQILHVKIKRINTNIFNSFNYTCLLVNMLFVNLLCSMLVLLLLYVVYKDVHVYHNIDSFTLV